MTGPALAGWARRTGRGGARAVVAVLPPWLVARAVVLATLGLAHLVVDRAHASAPAKARVHQGLLGWDAGWYEAIARHGYGPFGHQALRFFPLFPLAGRALASVPGVSAGAALVVLANLSALVATALLWVLVRRETGDTALADRSAWLLCLVPPAFVLVMGYAEATLLVFFLGCFLCLRHHRGRPLWWGAALCGLAAGLTRPLGLLLVVPVAIEAARHWKAEGWSGRAASVVATLSAPAGTAIFLGWSWGVFGDAFLPLRVQVQAGHHGGLTDPLRTLLDDARGVFHHHVGTALHIPWVMLAVALVVVCWWRLPAAYAGFATAVVAVAVSGTNLDSFERYALSAFPLVVAGATMLSGRRMERAVLALAAVGLAGYALLAFCNVAVP